MAQIIPIIGNRRSINWTEEAKAELRVIALHLHNLSIELSPKHPCASEAAANYARRIDALMAKAPETVS